MGVDLVSFLHSKLLHEFCSVSELVSEIQSNAAHTVSGVSPPRTATPSYVKRKEPRIISGSHYKADVWTGRGA